MVLQQTPTPIIKDPRQYITLIYGPSGVGKTTFGQQVEGHYFIKTEEGTGGLITFGSPALAWDKNPDGSVLQLLAEAVAEKRRGWKDSEGKSLREVKTIIFDTGDMLFELAADWVCKNVSFPEKGVFHKFDRIENVPYGKGYKAVYRLLRDILVKIRLYGFGVMVLCHSKEYTKKWRGQEFIAYKPNWPPSVVDVLLGVCDCVGFMHVEENYDKNDQGDIVSVMSERQLNWQSNFMFEAKHRLKGFPESITIGIDNGYQSYVDTFNETVQKFHGEEN